MKRHVGTAAVATLFLAGCGDSTPSTQKLAQCVQSWNARSTMKDHLDSAARVRVARYRDGTCAIVMNRDGVIGLLRERDAGWGEIVDRSKLAANPIGVIQATQREADAFYPEGNKKPNVTVVADGSLRALAGARIAELNVDPAG